MKSLLDSLAGIMNAAKDNDLGLIALAVLVVAVVAVLLLKNAPLWARVLSVLLVFVASAVPAVVVFDKLGGVAPNRNGSACENNTDCDSGQCYPGPHPEPDGSGLKFCLAADLNCALPGLDGAKYGTMIFKDATELTCSNPGNGRSAQFIRR